MPVISKLHLANWKRTFSFTNEEIKKKSILSTIGILHCFIVLKIPPKASSACYERSLRVIKTGRECSVECVFAVSIIFYRILYIWLTQVTCFCLMISRVCPFITHRGLATHINRPSLLQIIASFLPGAKWSMMNYCSSVDWHNSTMTLISVYEGFNAMLVKFSSSSGYETA